MLQIRRAFFTVFVVINISLAVKLPASFQKCKVSPELDRKPNECLAEAISKSVRLLGPGIKELNAQPLDPLNIIEMQVEKGGDGPVKMKFVYTNCLLSGLKDTKVLSVSGKLSSPDDFHLIMDVVLPSIEMKGPYSIKAHVILLSIEGEGQSKIVMTNSKYRMDIYAEKQIKNNETYLKLKNIKLSIEEPENFKVQLDNLFNGDKMLGDATNNFLNENWRDIFVEMKGPLTNALSMMYEEYARRILDKVPYEDLFIVE